MEEIKLEIAQEIRKYYDNHGKGLEKLVDSISSKFNKNTESGMGLMLAQDIKNMTSEEELKDIIRHSEIYHVLIGIQHLILSSKLGKLTCSEFQFHYLEEYISTEARKYLEVMGFILKDKFNSNGTLIGTIITWD